MFYGELITYITGTLSIVESFLLW